MKRKTNLTIKDFIEMENLELKYYSEEHVTPHEEAYQWHLAFPDTSIVLEEEGRIIAFLDMLPVQNAIFEGIRSGHFNDKYLTARDIVSMKELKSGDRVNLLLSCVVVDGAYRRTDALKIMLNDHVNYYKSFEERGIWIGYVITSNVTKAGERFSQKLNFNRIGTTDHHTALYLTDFHDFAEAVEKL